MEFVYYTEALRPVNKISADGLCPGPAFHLSHWRGNRTPPELKADTSTEIALRFAEHPDAAQFTRGIDIVSNNHYDADGVLTVFAVLRPFEALDRRELLVSAAEAGDFCEVTSDEGARLAETLAQLRASPDSPLAPLLRGRLDADADAIAYRRVLEGILDVLDEPERYEPLWRPAMARFERDCDAFEKGLIAITEYKRDRLTVVFGGPEPPSDWAIDRYTAGDLALVIGERKGGWDYRAAYRFYSWADTVNRDAIPQLDFAAVAAALNAEDEAGRGRFESSGYADQGLTEVLRYVHPRGQASGSGVPPDRVVRAIREQIRTSSPARA